MLIHFVVWSLSHVWLFAIPWTVPVSPASLGLAGKFFTPEPPGKPCLLEYPSTTVLIFSSKVLLRSFSK